MNNHRLSPFNFQADSPTAQPLVVAVMSGKGGVGKSVIAYNLGMITARARYRTLLLDANLNFGNLHILANCQPVWSLLDVLNQSAKPGQAIIRLEEYCDLLASHQAAEPGRTPDPSTCRTYFRHLKNTYNDYDLILIDTASSDLNTAEMIAQFSDINLMIVNPELTSLADGYGLFKFLMRIDQNIAAHLLVNRVSGEADYEFIYQKFTVLAQKFLNKVPLAAGFLMEDRYVIESVAHQRPLVQLKGEGDSVTQLTRLFNNLTKYHQFGRGNNPIEPAPSINNNRELADIKE